MLVNENLVKKWYKKDSQVYKSFAYIFQNPLWKKNIPQGFSVCPYFWLSMLLGTFLFFIFVPIVRLIRLLLFVPFLEPLDKLAFKIVNYITGKNKDYTPGVGLFLFGVSWVCFAVLVLILLFCGKFLLLAGESLKPMLFCTFSLLTFLIVLFFVERYRNNKNGECKVGTYYYLWGITALIVGFFIIERSEYFGAYIMIRQAISWIFINVWWIVSTCAIFIWHVISSFLFVGVLGGISVGAICLGFLIVFFPIGFLLQKYMLKDIETEEIDPEEFWFNYLAFKLAPEVKKQLQAYSLEQTRFTLRLDSCSREIREATKKAYRSVCVKYGLKSAFSGPGVKSPFDFKHVPLSLSYKLFEKFFLDNYFKPRSNDGYHDFNHVEYNKPLREIVVTEARNQLLEDNYIKGLLEENQKTFKENKEKFDKWDRFCRTLTNFLDIIILPFKFFFIGVGKIAIALLTFAVYLFVLAKAKKQKACPYFFFED